MTFLEYYVGVGNKEASIEVSVIIIFIQNLTKSIDESIDLEEEK